MLLSNIPQQEMNNFDYRYIGISLKLELDMSGTQFGFRRGLETRDALITFNVVV